MFLPVLIFNSRSFFDIRSSLIRRTVQCLDFSSQCSHPDIYINSKCNDYWRTYVTSEGTAAAECLRCCASNRKVAGSIPADVSGFFIDIKSFRSHYGPGVDSASNRNEYQEHFLGVKRGR